MQEGITSKAYWIDIDQWLIGKVNIIVLIHAQ